MPAIRVFGDPVAKGSMVCLGSHGGARFHQLVDTKAKLLKPWEAAVTAAGRSLVARHGTLSGPVIIDVTFTLARPATVPLSKRVWPITRSAGDADKLIRAVLDAFTTAHVWNDDSQVVDAREVKTYPDTPGCPDRLDRPGALIRIEQVT